MDATHIGQISDYSLGSNRNNYLKPDVSSGDFMLSSGRIKLL